MNISFYRLNSDDNLKQFNCGDSKEHKLLNKFLIERSLKHQNDLIGTTLLAKNEKNEIMGRGKNLDVKVSIDKFGNAVIKTLLIDGKEVNFN